MNRRTEIERVVQRCGGVADLRTLTRHVGRRAVHRALVDGVLERRGPGLYALPNAPADDVRVALEYRAVLAGLSAARYWGWEVLREPRRIDLLVRRHHAVPSTKRISVRRAGLPAGEVADGVVTAPLRTVLDCASRLPLDEAVAVADSALRSGRVDEDDLRAAAAASRGPGSAAKRRVAGLATAAAANPFESALRVRCLDAGLDVSAQVVIHVAGAGYDNTYRVDLADRDRGLVVEADSFAWHASPEAFAQDCVRYSELTAAGWTVLRMPYRAVLGDPTWCAGILGRFAAAEAYRSGPSRHPVGPAAPL